MAKFETRSPKNERIDLVESSPLSSPLTLLIEPVSVCSLKCIFCPTGDYSLSKSTGKFQGKIDYDLYKKIIQDCVDKKWKIKTLHLQKDGEPMLHPRYIDLCNLAGDSGVFDKIETTTNATMFPTMDLKRLAKSGLTRIKISIYGINEDDYLKNCRTNINFEKLVDKIDELYQLCKEFNGPQIYIKTMMENLGCKERAEEFLSIFDKSCDSIYIENCVENWPGYSLSDLGVSCSDKHTLQEVAGAETPKVICPQPFMNLTICADGTALACCADWQVKNRIGDVRTSSLEQIWNSEEMNDFRLMMIKGERFKHPICGSCNYPTQVCVDNMDHGIDRLMSKYGVAQKEMV